MYVSKESWQRYSGQTAWITVPGQGICHTVCGREITHFISMRTIWEEGPGPCAGTEVVPVSILQCTHCHSQPKIPEYGAPIMRDALMEVPD
jgi:hypothetical protein